MIQCSACEYYRPDAVGAARFACDPATNVKEPECLAKWQLIKLDAMTGRLDAMTSRLDTMVRAYQSTVNIYQRLAPLQEKMFRHMEREIDDLDEADGWKRGYDDEPDDDDGPYGAY